MAQSNGKRNPEASAERGLLLFREESEKGKEKRGLLNKA
jgi:hypothetical protein